MLVDVVVSGTQVVGNIYDVVVGGSLPARQEVRGVCRLSIISKMTVIDECTYVWLMAWWLVGSI